MFKILTAIASVSTHDPILQGPDFWYDKEFGRVWDIARDRYHQRKGFTDHAAYGRLNLETAIEVSCNSFFHEMAYNLGYDKMWAWANTFGFGEKTGAKLPEYNAWRNRSDGGIYNWLYPTTPSNPLEVALNGIGQGRLRVTPLQVARFMAAVATKGTLTTPIILLEDGGLAEQKYIDGINPAGWDLSLIHI